MFALTAASFAGFSQEKSSNPMSFSAGAEAVLPIGDLGLASSFGIGASAQMDYTVASNVALTANVGYVSYLPKESGFKSIGVLPVLAGVKYHFNDQFYGSVQLGMSFASSDGTSSSAFTYAPGVGYKINEQFDVLVKYNSWSSNGLTYSGVGLRVGYNF